MDNIKCKKCGSNNIGLRVQSTHADHKLWFEDAVCYECGEHTLYKEVSYFFIKNKNITTSPNIYCPVKKNMEAVKCSSCKYYLGLKNNVKRLFPWSEKYIGHLYCGNIYKEVINDKESL